MMFGRFGRMVGRFHGVTMRDMRMMTGLFVVAAFVVLRGFAMVFRGVLVVICRLMMVL
jgi:hypothetical protein